MSDVKRNARKLAEEFAAREPELTRTLGIILIMGMEEIRSVEKFAGTELAHTYRTHFPMGDGQMWHLTLAKEEATDAR